MPLPLPKTLPMRIAGGKTIQIPSAGFGTWADEDPKWCKEATLKALKAGYRHLDCAWKYGVDGPVGQAISESNISREDVFVTSKFWPNFARPADIELCLDKILAGMGLDYLDLFLAHWPICLQPTGDLQDARAGFGLSLAEQGILADGEGKEVVDLRHCTRSLAAQRGGDGASDGNGDGGGYVANWRAMQELVRKGKCRAIGVSNFSVRDLDELLPHSHDIPISCNQIEAHPWFPNSELIDFMQAHDILATCYSPFGGQSDQGAVMREDPRVKALAQETGMGVGGLLQSWAVQRGTVPLGKSQSEERIRANFDVKRLSPEVMRALDDLDMGGDEGRTCGSSKDTMWGVRLYQN